MITLQDFLLDCVQSLLYFRLDRSKKIGSHFVDQTGQAEVQPVIQIGLVHVNQIDQRFDKCAEHLAVGIVKHSRKDVRDFFQLCATVKTKNFQLRNHC